MADTDFFNRSPSDRFTEELQRKNASALLRPETLDGAGFSPFQDAEPPKPEPLQERVASSGLKVSEGQLKPPARSMLPPSNFMPLFESAAEKYNVPVNVLMGLAHQESRYNPTEIGPKTQWGHARGMMQYLDGTAKGLGINPFDPEQAIDAAAMQIRQRLDKGYSYEDAVKEHFAGPDRKLWGSKTRQYGIDVMGKAGTIGESLMSGISSTAQAAQPATPEQLQAELDAKEPGRFKVVGPDQLPDMSGKTEPAAEMGVADRFKQSFGQGYDSMVRSMGVTRAVTSGQWDSSSVDFVADAIEKAAIENKLIEARRHPQEKEISESLKRFGQSEGFMGTVKAAGDVAGTAIANPYGLALGTAEQAANMLPTVAGGIAGAGAGAAAGAVAGPAGAGIGGIWGSRAGMAAGTTALEFGNEVQQAITEKLTQSKLDPTKDNVKAVLADEQFRTDLTKQAATKGLVLGTVDALFFGLAGKVASAPAREAEKKAVKELAASQGVTEKAARGLLGTEAGQAALKSVAPSTGKRIAAGAGAVGTEFVGEPASEAASQLAARGTIDKADVAAEALYGAGTSVATGTAAASVEAARRTFARPGQPAADGAAPSDTAPQTDPNATPTQAQAQAPTRDTSGPLSRSVNKVTENAEKGAAEAQARRVTVETPTGTVTGFLDTYAEDGQGGFEATVLSDDGERMTFTHEDGVNITPEGQQQEQQQAASRPETVDEDGVIHDASTPPADLAEKFAKEAPAAEFKPTTEIQGGDQTAAKAAETPAVAQSEGGPKEPVKINLGPKIGRKVIGFPDDAHRELYDFGSFLHTVKIGGSTLSHAASEKASEARRKVISDATGIPLKDVTSAALDYRADVHHVARTSQGEQVEAPTFGKRKVKKAEKQPVKNERDLSAKPELGPMFGDPKGGTTERAVLSATKEGRFSTKDPISGNWKWMLRNEYATEGKGGKLTLTPKGEARLDAVSESLATEKKSDVIENNADVVVPADTNQQVTPELVKWFGSREKADAFVAKKNLAATHDVVPVGKSRFEIHPKKQDAAATPVPDQVADTGKPIEEHAPAPEKKFKPAQKPGPAAPIEEQVQDFIDGKRDTPPGLPDSRPEIIQQLERLGVEPSQVAQAQRELAGGDDTLAKDLLRINRPEPEADNKLVNVTKSPGVTTIVIDPSAARKPKQEPMPTQTFESKAGVGKIFAVKERYSDKFGVSWSSTNIAGADTMEQAASIAKAVAESGADNITAMREVAKAHVEQKPDAASTRFANNKVFTQDKVAAARARLKSKLNQLNSGIDPEVMIDGMTIAGAYIEEGVRDFSAYSKAMVEDFGDKIKPYLRSFYDAVRSYPGINVDGMTPYDETVRLHEEMLKVFNTEEVKEAVGEVVKKPAKRTKKTGKASDRTLTQDFGVEHIDGYSEDSERDAGNSVKDAFLKDARGYLNAVADILTEQSYTLHTDKKGRPEKAVHVNEGGVAGSGEVSLTLQGPDGEGIYVDISGSALAGMVPATRSGVSIMFRSTPNSDRFGGRINRWAPVDLSAADLAIMLDAEVRKAQPKPVKKEVANDTDTNQRDIRDGGEGSGTRSLFDNEEGGGTGPVSEPTDGGRAGSDIGSQSDDGQRSGVPQDIGPAQEDAGSEQPGESGRGTGNRAGVGGNRQPKSAGPGRAGREPEPVRNDGGQSEQVPGQSKEPISAAKNYRIQPGELTRRGSWKDAAERNVEIIELVKDLQKTGRVATPEEKALLTRYTGWGASEVANGIFPNQYGQYKDGWRELGERLKSALTPEEYEQARRTTQYAHYTSEGVIRSIYSGLDRLGFKGGSIMEPGMGIGLFNGLMPDGMVRHSTYTGIEFDTTTGAIAKALYPASNIVVGDFSKTALPANFFDAAIGNPPFSSTKVLNDPEYKKHGFMLHDYFFAKTIDRVRPGGLVVFVTSKGTMDKGSDKARKYLADRANLVGAVRLPQTAFKGNAGTEVVTDVIFLQKRGEGVEDNGVKWLGTTEIPIGNDKAHINEYFAAHPEMVLGTHALTGTMYRANEYTVEPRQGEDIEGAFAKAVETLPEAIYSAERSTKADVAQVQDRDFNPKNKKEGGIYIADDGRMMQVVNGSGVPLTHRIGSSGKEIVINPNQKRWLRGWIGVRDALRQTQYDQLNDGNWAKSLKALNDAYDAFVKEQGNILAYSTIERVDDEGNKSETKRFKNESLFHMDAEGALAWSLEVLAEDGSISKGAVLNGRVINKPKEPEIHTVQDAMFVSLNKIGKFDIDDIAKRAGMTKDAAIAELGTSIYEAPGEGWQTADEYLSGDVLKKLKEARQIAETSPRYKRNVDALIDVQPKPLGPQDITVRLGANWVPSSDITDFASEALNEQMAISYNDTVKSWTVKAGERAIASEWRSAKMSAAEILDAVLNSRQIRITYRDSEGKTHLEPEDTEKANDIANKMRDAFRRWLWTNPERTSRLVKFYNDHFNNIAPRKFDGSHLTLPGVSSRFSLYPHQKRAVWRNIQQGDTYLAHAVGAGKTYSMIASGMEQRRLGLISKPLYSVPNHMLAQFSREFQELYPTAHIMVADERNFGGHNRRRFVAQAALNNPDAIIITHSAFGRVGMSPEFQADFINRQIDEWRDALADVDKSDRITTKQIERRIEQLEKRLEGKQGTGKDKVLSFEELGVDYIFFDEMHEARKLDFTTNQGNIKGVDPDGSQRAMDLMMKVQYLRSKKPGRSITGASGTPITNTMGELFTVQRFFQPAQIELDGTDTFDTWSAQYGATKSELEQNAAGGYQAVTRFATFQNVPELMRRVRSFMDILTSNQLGDLVKRPTIETGSRQIIVTPVPAGYKEYQKTLESRIRAIKERKGPPQPGDDIILSVITDGKFSAIDMRFVDPTLPPDPDSKLNRMLDDVIAAYKATIDNEYTNTTTSKPDPIKGSSILVFTDIGLGEQAAANRGFDMKAWMVKRMTEAGIPREHIAFMRDHKQHAKKGRLFADMKDGTKRILIGGKDMETGVNVQKRLTHLFHLDAPWFPASIEQREGRGLRQGNQNEQIVIKPYATKGSYDSTMWGMNARKMRFISQAMEGDESIRNLEDVSEASSFQMASALASGDERYMKLAGLRGDVERLERLRRAHFDEQSRLMRDKNWAENTIERADKRIADLKETIAKRKPIKVGEFLARVGNKPFDKRDEFSGSLFEKARELATKNFDGTQKIGEIAGFDIKFYGMKSDKDYAGVAALDMPNDPNPLASFPTESDFAINGIAARAVNQVNRLDLELSEAEQSKVKAQRQIAQIESREGAPFAEEGDFLDKYAQLNELETELATESAAAEAAAKAEATAQPQATSTNVKNSEDAAETQTGTPAFKRWFSGSKVVDAQGAPLVMYHGTQAEFSEFDKRLQKGYSFGLHFTDSRKEASIYADSVTNAAEKFRPTSPFAIPVKDGANVMPVYLQAKNPLVVDTQEISASMEADFNKASIVEKLDVAKREGTPFDSVIIRRKKGDGFDHINVIVFEPTQIKSAIGNRGTFDPTNPDIRASEEAVNAAEALDVQSLRKIITAGPLGMVVGRAMIAGRIVLHNTAPNGVKSTVLGYTDDDNIVHLIADRLDAQTALPVLLHEVFHAGGQPLLGDKKWADLMRRLASLHRQFEHSPGSARNFYQKAARRMAEANTISPEEFGAYAIEEYEQAPGAIRKWVDDLIGAVKAWLLRKFGAQMGEVTPAQLRKLAIAALHENMGNRPGPGDGTRNSETTQTETPAFKRWFGKSQIADVNGSPQVVYHGTNADFTTFNMKRGGSVWGTPDSEEVMWFASNVGRANAAARDAAEERAETDADWDAKTGANVMPVYLRMENPKRVSMREVLSTDQLGAIIQKAKKDGRDGIILTPGEMGGQDFAVFSPEQIKSATGNRGTSDPTNPDIRYSERIKTDALNEANKTLREEPNNTRAERAPDEFVAKSIRDMDGLTGMFQRIFVHPYTIAALYKDFTPVFRTAISQTERRNVIMEDLNKDFTPYRMLPSEGRTKVNKLIELGRLMGKEFSASDLKAGIKNPGKVKAVKMVDDKPTLAEVDIQAGLTKIGETVALNDDEAAAYKSMRKMFNDALDMFRDMTLREMGLEQFAGKADASKLILDEAKRAPNAAEKSRLANAAKFIADIEQSKRAGYVPFSRYGDYVIAVKDGDRTIYSEKVETGLRDMLGKRKAKRNELPVDQIPSVKKAMDRIRKKYPDNKLVAFETTQKRPDGSIDLSSLDALAEIAQIDNTTWDSIREKLSTAIKGTGFRKHFFSSEHIPGYSLDFERSIADYVAGMAGYVARREHLKQWEDSIGNVKGDKLYKYSTAYRDYVNNPREELAMLRQLGFFMYMGFNLSSAMVNSTQVPLMTVPFLTQVANPVLVNGELMRAYKDVAKMFRVNKKTGMDIFDLSAAPADLKDELARAHAEGLFLPLQSLEMFAMANQRTPGQRKFRRMADKITQVGGLPFTAVERSNRLVTFVAAARLAKKSGVKQRIEQVFKNDALASAVIGGERFSPYTFGEYAVDETQYKMGKINRPTVMRGPGTALLQFKGYMMQTLEAMYRNASLHGPRGKAATLATLGMMIAFSGIWGVPGGDNLRDLLEELYKMLTKRDLDVRTEARKWVQETTDSRALAEVFDRGVPFPSGADLSRRVGLGEIVPQYQQPTGMGWLDALITLGGVPASMLIGKPFQAAGKLSQGDTVGTAGALAPTAFTNLLTGMQWKEQGIRTLNGRRILAAEDVPESAAIKKMIGIQPPEITNVRDYDRATRRKEHSLDALKRDLTDRLTRATADLIRNDDPAKEVALDVEIAKIYQEIDSHNDKATTEEDMIDIKASTIRQKMPQELGGVPSRFGKEKKSARESAETMRGLFGVDQLEK